MNPEERKAKRAAYMREYRRQNPEKVLAAEARSRAKRTEAQKVLARAWYEQNIELCKQRAHEHYRANQQKHVEHGRQWRASNKDKINAYASRKRADQLQATPCWADATSINLAYENAQVLTAETGISWHVDHIIPLRSRFVCGLHTHTNLQVIPANDNQQKSNRWWLGMWGNS